MNSLDILLPISAAQVCPITPCQPAAAPSNKKLWDSPQCGHSTTVPFLSTALGTRQIQVEPWKFISRVWIQRTQQSFSYPCLGERQLRTREGGGPASYPGRGEGELERSLCPLRFDTGIMTSFPSDTPSIRLGSHYICPMPSLRAGSETRLSAKYLLPPVQILLINSFNPSF